MAQLHLPPHDGRVTEPDTIASDIVVLVFTAKLCRSLDLIPTEAVGATILVRLASPNASKEPIPTSAEHTLMASTISNTREPEFYSCSSRSGPGSEDETSSSTPIRRHSGTSSRPAPSASAPASPRALANDAANSEEATRRIAAEEAERARLAVENAERERIAAEKADRARQEKEARVKAEEQECARIEAERIAPAEAALAQTDNTRSDSQFSTSLHPTQPALAPGRSDDNTLHPASNSEDAAITHTPTRQIDAYFGTVKQILHKQLQNLLSGKGLAQQQWNRQRDGSRSGSDYNLRSISHSENTSTSAVPEPQTDCTSSGSELSSSSPQTSDTGDDSDGEQAFNTNWIVVPLLDGDTTPTKVVIYAALLSFLKGACNTKILGSRKVASLQTDLDGYLVSMAFDSVVTAIVESLKCRKTLLELSSKHGFSNDPRLRTALRIDEERIASLLVSVFDSKSAEDAVLRLEGDSAECFLDVVQDTLDKGLLAQEHSRMAQRLIRKVSESSDRLPPSLFITGVSGREEHPTFGGAQGEIYRASYGDKPVALKHMRYRLRGTDLRRIRSKFCREALVWKDLHHPNILPFLGIDRDSFPSCDSLCMVSPWMKNGTVMNYLKVYGHANVDKLLYEIAQGLQYLHSRNIVHGDLKGENILVNEDWSASLADFGLSLFLRCHLDYFNPRRRHSLLDGPRNYMATSGLLRVGEHHQATYTRLVVFAWR
ncbi:Kinase-like protein [Mycena venus]|uniref:Kinase-like protein n=1 Tax=Mycena venus TaxID=2733690 RepID=A0A8H7D4U7_9AGAR|nr:Kinase-like protein [Mycena venus]